METLNDEQRAVVEADGHVLVSAGPGSGKTRVLIARAEHLIRQADAHQVIAVTFSREAATEMLQRMNHRALPACQRRRFNAGTFHALALNQLTTAGKVSASKLLKNHEWIALLENAIHQAKAKGCALQDKSYEEISLAIQGLQVEEEEPGPADPGKDPMRYLYRIFMDYKAKSEKLDFADLIRQSIEGMRNHTLPPLPCTHLLVDEAQDIDGVQYTWIRTLAQRRGDHPGAFVTLVGDDDQGIYGWRHAQGYKGMMRFKSEFHATHITLSVNYRCAPEILEPAGRLIKHNLDRVDKAIRAAQPAGGSARHQHINDAKGELEKLEEWFFNSPEETIAYIARTNSGLNHIELLLREQALPYQRNGGGSFLEHPPIMAMHQLLLFFVLADKKPQVARGHLRFALLWAQAPYPFVTQHLRGKSEFGEVLEVMDRNGRETLPAPTQELLEHLAMNYRNYRTNVAGNRARVALFGASERIKQIATKDMSVDETERECSQIDLYTKIVNEAEGRGTLAHKLIRLEASLRPSEAVQQKARITLLTAHASKGREFDDVLISRAESDVFPHRRNPEIDEERRLMYVAMTRAKKHLLLTCRPDKTSSQFLSEAGLLQGG